MFRRRIVLIIVLRKYTVSTWIKKTVRRTSGNRFFNRNRRVFSIKPPQPHRLVIKPPSDTISRLCIGRLRHGSQRIPGYIFIVYIFIYMRVCVIRQSHLLSSCRTSAVELHNVYACNIIYIYIFIYMICMLYIPNRTYHRRHLSGFPREQIFARRFPKGITTLDRIPTPPSPPPRKVFTPHQHRRRRRRRHHRRRSTI